MSLYKKKIQSLEGTTTTATSLAYFLHQFFSCCFKLLCMEWNITIVSLNPGVNPLYFCPFCIEKSSLEEYKLVFRIVLHARLDKIMFASLVTRSGLLEKNFLVCRCKFCIAGYNYISYATTLRFSSYCLSLL